MSAQDQSPNQPTPNQTQNLSQDPVSAQTQNLSQDPVSAQTQSSVNNLANQASGGVEGVTSSRQPNQSQNQLPATPQQVGQQPAQPTASKQANLVAKTALTSAIQAPVVQIPATQASATQTPATQITTSPPVAATQTISSQQQQQEQPQQEQPQQEQPKFTEQDLVGLSPFLKVLVKKNSLDLQRAEEINSAQLSSGRLIEELLTENKDVTEEQLVRAKAEFNNTPFIKIGETGISPEALSRIDESVARRYKVLPFSLDHQNGILEVAMVDPLNVAAANFIEKKSGLDLKTYYALPSELDRLINQRYAQDLSSDVSQAIKETTTISTKKDQGAKLAQKGGMIRAAPINKIVNTILDYAMESRASDVHIEPQQTKTRIRYRIDGVLQERLILPKSVHDAVISRIKILSELKIDEKRVPQDGRFDHSSNNKAVDLRVSTCPTIHGEKVVMRLLKKNAGVPGLRELGVRGLALKSVEKTMHIPYGIILVTGPTGSGKTTTLYSILNEINIPQVNIITLEDPVEYQMKGVSQVQVNPQAGLTFANGLRSFLRQDPNIIMVGEIRDEETAELAVQASLTGHLVFSTLHTNSAAGALPRLMDMGVEPFLLSSSIILTMGQRVVRKINEEYKEEYQPEKAVIDDIRNVLGQKLDMWCQQNNKDPNDLTLFRAKEDRPQTESEFKGMIGIFEVMDITDKIKKLIDERATSDKIEKAATENGMMLMKQDGYIKALEGITTIEEVIRVAEVK
ncbi:MAG: ATPase, T2SS/T4P/T4SS family [Patescibacteria group bacterium]|nr:ATPase, T2SS/T4P/T4SS family [Patescibacteria group bacterium]